MVGKRRANVAALVTLGVLWAASSVAEGAECFSYGYEDPGRSVNGPLALGRVNNQSPRVNFVKSSYVQASCPSKSASCQDKAYLVPGDEVVIIGAKDDFLCIGFVNRKGRVSNGWFPRSSVTPVQERATIRSSDWVGQWRSDSEQTIVIEPSPQGSKLKIRGDATWGAFDPERVKRGAVNIGTLEGEVAADSETLSFGMGEDGTLPYENADEYDCKIQMQRLGPYLLANDNGMCGGHNVTFTGIYRRP
jgi:hypothetical protein